MKLSHLTLVGAVVLVAAGAGLAFTMPGSTPYDGLIFYDPAALPLVPGALHIHGAIAFDMASKGFDKDGNSVDFGDMDQTIIGIPLNIGYAFDERWSADVTVQLLQNKIGDTSTFGLGDLWVKTRALWETGPDFYLGPRLAVKAPIGKWKDLDVDQLPLGDGQMDVDLAAVAAKYGTETPFKATGALGFRYRMKRSYSVTVVLPPPLGTQTYDVDYTPGMMIYTHLEPGLGIGDQKFQLYVPIGYETTMEDKTEFSDPSIPTPEGMTTSALYVGLHPKYAIDEYNTLGLSFLYTVMGKNVPQGMLIGLTANSYIPLK